MSTPSASEPRVTPDPPLGEVAAAIDSAAIDQATLDRFAADLAAVTMRVMGGPALARIDRYALAVSGGPDSMAMLVLAATALPGRVIAATVDHGLRPAAAGEAALVAGVCARLGVPHATLPIAAPLPDRNLQSHARTARYAALSDWAAGAGVPTILTAHHADDQAETLLMRLNRGSGLAGLAAIRPYRIDPLTTVLRPLLNWRRAALRAIVAAAGVPFIDDPSNDDPRHDRTRIRALLAENPALDPAALAASAAYLFEVEEAIGSEVEDAWAEHWHGAGRVFAVADLSREVQRRLLRRAIAAVRAEAVIVLPPFGDAANVEASLDTLAAGRSVVQGGVMVSPGAAGWTFRPAPPRRATPARTG